MGNCRFSLLDADDETDADDAADAEITHLDAKLEVDPKYKYLSPPD